MIVLTGARQTGKTSTLLRLFPQHALVSLDLPTEAEQAEKEPRRFLQRHPPPVIIDEVQYAPGLFRHLKAEVDANRNAHGQFLLTGSQKFTLMANVSESLAGRADIMELETLSYAEIRADLARDVGISPSTANQWLSLLEASGQVVLLEPWVSNRTRSIVKSPKLYLADTGLLCALLNIRSVADLDRSPAVGAIWETFVFAQLRGRERRAGHAGSLFFWRDRTREVDFLVDAGGRLELFEAKRDGKAAPPWCELLPGLGLPQFLPQVLRQHLVHGPFPHHPPVLHHQHPVGHGPHHVHVVGHQDV